MEGRAALPPVGLPLGRQGCRCAAVPLRPGPGAARSRCAPPRAGRRPWAGAVGGAGRGVSGGRLRAGGLCGRLRAVRGAGGRECRIGGARA